jgi:hypothetical protein
VFQLSGGSVLTAIGSLLQERADTAPLWAK